MSEIVQGTRIDLSVWLNDWINLVGLCPDQCVGSCKADKSSRVSYSEPRGASKSRRKSEDPA